MLHCLDCTNFRKEANGNFGLCSRKNVKVWEFSVTCREFDDTRPF